MSSSSALTLINGFPRMTAIVASLPLIYDNTITIVSSGGNGSTTLNGPITSSTAITLPSSGTYTLNTNSVPNLQIYLNGQRLEESGFDWNTSGSGPSYTAFSLTFGLV